jgi:AraC-like DNA-binding protein
VFTLSTTEDENVTENQEIGAQVPVSNPQYHKVLINNNLESVIVENRYYQDNTLTLQKLAQLLGTNRQYLSNYINQEKHVSFYDYINDFRLEEAKRLLESKDEGNKHSVEEISLMSGFNSYITFLRSFKKKYGQTPLQYFSNRN